MREETQDVHDTLNLIYIKINKNRHGVQRMNTGQL